MAVPSTSQAIQQQIAGLAADLNNQVAIQRAYRRTGTGALGTTYKLLGGQLAELGNRTHREADVGRQTVQSDYSRAGQNISDAEATVRELLGSQGGLQANVASGPLAEIQKLNAERGLAEANSLSSQATLGTGYINAARASQSDAKREGAQAKFDLTSQIGADIGEMQRQYLKEKGGLQVQYAQTLAEERYREQQLALERAKLAAENEARRAAAAADKQRYTGQEGVLQWAKANGIPIEEVNQIMAAANQANESGSPADAYFLVKQAFDRQKSKVKGAKNVASAAKRGQYDKEPYSPFVKGAKLPNVQQYNLDRLNTGLNIFFGNYASYE